MEDPAGTFGEILLTESDFPDYFINWAHPEDYKITKKPIIPEYIFHQQKLGTHARLLFRCSFELAPNTFTTMTFVVDTGAPKPFYFAAKAMDILKGREMVHGLSDVPLAYLKVNGRNAIIEETPYIHKWANLLGLNMITRLGLAVTENDDREGSFVFTKMPQPFFSLKSAKKL